MLTARGGARNGFIVDKSGPGRAAGTRIVRVMDCGTCTGCAGQVSICNTNSTVGYSMFDVAPWSSAKNFYS